MPAEFSAERLLERAAQIDTQASTWRGNLGYVETLRMEAWALRQAAKLHTPETEDWFDGVRFEAGHQVLRYGAAHDAGKSPLDWFWLVGYLAQKAVTAASLADIEKAKHHTISTAAALLNWHRQLSGKTDGLRPGIDPAERRLEIAEGS
jgi:hypothetical protein